MSTFGGLMKEYRLISLDRFNGVNLDSTVYMLSHNHSGENYSTIYGKIWRHTNLWAAVCRLADY